MALHYYDCYFFFSSSACIYLFFFIAFSCFYLIFICFQL